MTDHQSILEQIAAVPEGTTLPELELNVLSPNDIVPEFPAIGAGGYADVYKALFRKKEGETVEVVVKVIRGGHFEKNEEQMKVYTRRLRREYGVWGSLSHPNVICLEGIVEHPLLLSAGLVSPYKPLFDLVRFEQGGGTYDRLSMAQGVACGLAYLHYRDVVHGDLTAVNILVHKTPDGAFIPMISDFGKSRVVGVKGHTSVMTDTPLLARPPEFLVANNNDKATAKKLLIPAFDVYSLSLVLLELLTGKKAYCEETGAGYMVIMSIVNDQLRPCQAKYPMIDQAHNYIWPILEDCWRKAPSDRISSKVAHERLCQAPTSVVHN